MFVPDGVRHVDDTAQAVRGGIYTVAGLRGNAQTTYQVIGIYGISMWAAVPEPGEDENALLSRIIRAARVPHNRINMVGVGQLREQGMFVHGTPPGPYHVDVELGPELTDESIDAFMSVFGPTVENPIPQEERMQWNEG